MIVQIINNKIITINVLTEKPDFIQLFPIDIEILPKTEEGELDYEAIFALEVEVIDNEIVIK